MNGIKQAITSLASTTVVLVSMDRRQKMILATSIRVSGYLGAVIRITGYQIMYFPGPLVF
jgi:hypothetical protein